MSRFNGSIKGIQEAQAAALQALAALQPDGALGKAVQYITAAAGRYAVQNTVVDTGSWRASHRPVVQGLTGRVFLDPAAVSPRGGRPAVYGAALAKKKGGRYDVYKQTVEQAGPEILRQAGHILQGGLP